MTTNERSIKFKHTDRKNLAFKNELTLLITFALKALTQERITEKHLSRIKELLKNEPKDKIMADFK